MIGIALIASVTDITGNYYVVRSAIYNNLAYLLVTDLNTSANDFFIFTVDNTTGQIINKTERFTWLNNGDNFYNDFNPCAIYNDRLYYQLGDSIKIFDISNQNIPVFQESINTSTVAFDQRNLLSNGGGIIYSVGKYFISLAVGINGTLNILEQILLPKSVAFNNGLDQIKYNNDKIFAITDDALDLYILDVSNSLSMSLTTHNIAGKFFCSVMPDQSNNYLYLFVHDANSTTFLIYNIFDGAFVLVNSVPHLSFFAVPKIIDLFSTTLFVSEFDNTVSTINIENPFNISFDLLLENPYYYLDLGNCDLNNFNSNHTVFAIAMGQGSPELLSFYSVSGIPLPPQPTTITNFARISNFSRYLTFGKDILN